MKCYTISFSQAKQSKNLSKIAKFDLSIDPSIKKICRKRVFTLNLSYIETEQIRAPRSYNKQPIY